MEIFSTMSLYQMGIYFLIYAFVGWCIEVVYYSVSVGRFVNRGFLSGPLCPIYGFGALSVILLLTPISNSLLLLFAGSVVLCTLVELLGGFALNKMFHARWWDYSDEPFNVGGYICLKFSLLWGIACVLLMRVIHPFIREVVSFIPTTVELVILFVLYALLFVDIVATVVEVRRLNKDLGELTQLLQSLHLPSDILAEKLGSGAIAVAEKLEALHLEEKSAAFAQQVLHIPLPDSIVHKEHKATSANAATADGPQFGADAAKPNASTTQSEADSRIFHILHNHKPARKRILTAFPKAKNNHYPEALQQMLDSNAAKCAAKNKGKAPDSNNNLSI